ncbi:PQQ-binding-like beta-propeller repeat protein [Candidatus Pelagibacter sp.]|nr:PQQ-binding-like beta-propeller repeat protein [Candidatus Pelagibacter sp.]
MNKVLIYKIFIIFLFLNNCSLNENSRIWKDKDKHKDFIKQENVKKLFVEEDIISTEFNPDLKIYVTKINEKDKYINNTNNYGSQNYDGFLNKERTYTFSKLDNINQLDFKPAFLPDGLIFFDKKGVITRYDDKKKIIWKNNYYSKAEKKLKPKLNFLINNNILIVVDNISKYYSVNINTGKLNWSKNNNYPFNSDIKKYKDKFFVVDYKNVLRCFNINDGSECWRMRTEDSFTISDSKFSQIIINDLIIFNNSIGDITAVDIETGLINWQLPTQSSSIINKTYRFKNSQLVSDGNSIFFSNNKNEFYSIDAKTGTINWKNKINSNLMPVINENLIFTVSNNGYLFIIEKNSGNIIRITNLYKSHKKKKKKNLIPIGFAIGKNNLYLTSNDGKMIVVDLEFGKVIKEIKISGKLVSAPLIFNKKLFLIKSNSITRYN